MIASHDAFSRLEEIGQPTLVLCGKHNFCTPMPCSEELARTIPSAEFVVLQDAGELIEIEKEVEFFEILSGFIDRHLGTPSDPAANHEGRQWARKLFPEPPA